MDRIFEAGAALAPPGAPASPSSGYPTAGNPGTGTQPTKPGPYWFYQITEELRAVIVAAGITPDHEAVDQLSAAIQALIQLGNRSIVIEAAVFNAGVANGNAVYWDSGNARFDKALAAGGAAQNAVGFADVTNAKVYVFGATPLFVGLAPGSRYYLSGTVAGAITTTAPANVVPVGIARTTTELMADVAVATQPITLTGMAVYFPATSPPAGFVKANGALLSRVTYAALWAYAQTSGNLAANDGAWVAGQFSPGDGATTFRIPDGRGEFLRGWDDGRGVDAGRTIGSAQADEFKAHTHLATQVYTSGGDAGGAYSGWFASLATSSTGGAETRPRNIALLACIKY